MKNRRYIPYGPHGDEHPVVGSVLDILIELPGMVRKKRRIPPLVVINMIMSQGRIDSGMSGGCKWESFVIDENEYASLIEHSKNTDWTYQKYPDWIETPEHFEIWQYYIDFNIPWSEHKRLSDIYVETERVLKMAMEQDEAEEMMEKLHLERVIAGQEMNDYFMEKIEEFHNKQ